MNNKSTSKTRSKKLLTTTLGKAPSCTADEAIDLSHVRKPIGTSIFGLREVLRLFETATDEVRRYVAYECDLIYECRACRTIYRSLANFILHKRSYCTGSCRSSVDSNSYNTFQPDEFNLAKQNKSIFDCDNYPVTSPIHQDSNFDAAVNNPKMETKKKKELIVALNRLYNKQESNFITEQCLSEEASNESQTSERECTNTSIALQKLESSNVGVYQTILPNLRKHSKLDLMKTEVMEIHNILEHNEAILGIDGKALVNEIEQNSVLKTNYTCNVCNQKCSTKKTLTYHIRYKHNTSTLIYPCTECKETFANAWSVFRHLCKVHQKSTTQVRKLRNIIHNSAIKRKDNMDRQCKIDKSSSGSELSEMADQQWMDNLEKDNDLQRCGGCGRKFERKAALHSHSQFCAKRNAVCNSLKENSSKKVQIEENPDKINKTLKNDLVNIDPTRRRKPLTTHKIERNNYSNDVSMLEEIIGPLPYQNDVCLTIEHINESYNGVCQANDKNKLENISINSKETCNPGTPAVDIHISEKMTVSNSENVFEAKQVSEDYVYNTYENGEKTFDSIAMIIVDESNMDNKLKEEKEDPSASFEVCNANVNSHCDSDLKNSNCDNLITDVIHEPCTSGLKTVNKSDISLEKKSSNYINIEKQTCLPCKKRFNTYRLLMKHMALHFSWYHYQCSICKYFSYTKSTCKHHVMSKHNFHDKVTLSTIVKRIPRSKTRETATNFIKRKRKKALTIKANKETKIDSQEIHKNSLSTKTDDDDEASCVNIQDPLVRQMVMEVIFGTMPTVPEEELSVNCVSGNEGINYPLNDDVTEKTLQCEMAEENSCTRKTPPLELPESQSQDFSRPIRTRIVPLRKDFLYDMKHPVKQKRVNDRKFKSKVKLCSKREKVISYSTPSNISTNKNIDCVRTVNMSSDDIALHHVTGDIVCTQ